MPVKIRVRDFQSLGDISLVVDKLTVVTGANNTGKTALMRAVRAAFQNAKGTGFIRHGSSKAVVDIDFGGGHTLTWEKGKGKGDKPTYIVDGGPPIHPGQGVPDEVRALGVRPITAGGREVWPQIAAQFTGQVFLLDQPGSVMAEAVADVERVSSLNEALRMAASDKRSATSELQTRRDDDVRYGQELARFTGLDEASVAVDKVEEVFTLAQRASKALDSLLDLQSRRSDALQSVSDLQGINSVDVPPREDFTALAEIQRDTQEVVRIRDQRERALSRVRKLAGIESVEVDVDLTSAEKTLGVLQVVVELRRRIRAAQEQVASLTGELDKLEKEETHASEELFGILGGLGQCPVCGGHIAPEGE